MSDHKWLLSTSRGVLRDGTVKESKVVMHLCSEPGCNRWGAFLIGAHWLKDIRGTAYCREHLPVNEALALGMHNTPAQQAEANDAQGNGPSPVSSRADVDD